MVSSDAQHIGNPALDQSPRVRLYLALSLLLFFLAVWKGEPHGGYCDIRDYMRAAEALWLRGELFFVAESDEAPAYQRYTLGLPILSGPFVLAGHALEKWTNGFIGQRAVIALIIPLMTVGAGLLIFAIGRALECPARSCLWAVVLFALGSPILTFVRLYYIDMAVVFLVLLAIWSALRALQAVGRADSSPYAWRWTALTGLSLAAITVTHYAASVMCCGLWLGTALGLLSLPGPTAGNAPRRRRYVALAALCAVPVIAAAALLAVNYYRFDSPFSSGYNLHRPDGTSSMFTTTTLGRNFVCLASFCWRVPWVLLGLWGLVLSAFSRAAPRALFIGILLALGGQVCLWLVFSELIRFPVRYPLPLLSLLVIGLLLAGRKLSRRWPRRGLAYSGLVCVCWNVAYFLRGEDVWPSFFIDPRRGPDVLCHVWYMTPFPSALSRGWGTPVGWTQAAVLLALLAGASISLWLAFREAARVETAEHLGRLPLFSPPLEGGGRGRGLPR